MFFFFPKKWLQVLVLLMPIPRIYRADFEETGIYHVYNRTNNREKLFLSEENKYFFLRKLKELLSPVSGIYCWCLLPNHFHFLLRIKEEKEIIAYLGEKEKQQLTITEKKYLSGVILLDEIIEGCFKRFFQSYALSFNKVHSRSGNLFYKPFKRVRIDSDTQFTHVVIYIHANALKHKLCNDLTEWKWSSFHSLISDNPTTLLRNELMEWFGGREQFIKTHLESSRYYCKVKSGIED